MNDTATTFNGYEYNEFGVCMNPDIPYTFGRYNDYHFSIKVSETPRGWVYGYDWANKSGGGGGGCWLNTRTCFPSRSRAILDCAYCIKERYRDDNGASKAMAELDRIISKEITAAEALSKVKTSGAIQLSLFEF